MYTWLKSSFVPYDLGQKPLVWLFFCKCPIFPARLIPVMVVTLVMARQNVCLHSRCSNHLEPPLLQTPYIPCICMALANPRSNLTCRANHRSGQALLQAWSMAKTWPACRAIPLQPKPWVLLHQQVSKRRRITKKWCRSCMAAGVGEEQFWGFYNLFRRLSTEVASQHSKAPSCSTPAWLHRMLEGKLHWPTIQNRLKNTSQKHCLKNLSRESCLKELKHWTG
jgi:hypothetical protein